MRTLTNNGLIRVEEHPAIIRRDNMQLFLAEFLEDGGISDDTAIEFLKAEFNISDEEAEAELDYFQRNQYD